MPDKPKRRKNKNKRKNKNQNKNNVNKSENSDTVSVDSCDCQENVDDGCENKQSEIEKETTSILENANVSQTNNLCVSLIPQPSTLLDESDKPDDKENISISHENDKLQIEEVVTRPLAYVVESPDTKKKNPKLNNAIKSKSADNDESPSIVEITEEIDNRYEGEKNVALVATSNVIITDAESDVEWEKTDELHEISKASNLAAEAFSVMTIPLQIAQCKQTQALNIDQEKSLRNYLETLNLSTSPSNLNSLEIRSEIEQIINREIKHRLRKKALAEETLFSRGTITRGLDVIDEEGSGESSATSRRHSYLSDKKSDTDDLEDEVFENKQIVAFQNNIPGIIRTQTLIPQQCILVDAKIKEPEITEARGDWSLKTVEKITGAEVVYLTDSSSSTSSLYDVGEDVDNDEVSDTSIRIITPTIEVTDTEKFLTNTFIAKDKGIDKEEKNQERENEINDDDNKLNSATSQETTTNLNQNPHEIVVLSTEDIKTNLFVKDTSSIESEIKPNDNDVKEIHVIVNKTSPNTNNDSKKDTYDLEIKVLKCELNDAINNLIKEFTPDSDLVSDNQKDAYTRQDSSSSVSSSQCTAKYNPNYSSLNDVSNIMHEDNTISSSINIKNHNEVFQNTDTTSHVKEVFQCVAGDSTDIKNYKNNIDPLPLKDLCVKKIASFPFGNKVLEELAHVSERLQRMSILALQSKDSSQLFENRVSKSNLKENHQNKMPYFPLPDISTIEEISLSTKDQEQVPPPVHPRNSSLRKSQDEQHWTAIPTAVEPVYVCLSPSQKTLMEKTNTVIKKEDASQLMDIHKKFVDRRGYNEKLNGNIDTTPIVPFKSQTGSRLLALIRDPSVTNNINLSSSQKTNFKSLESLPKFNYFESSNSKVSESFTDSEKHTKQFRPIPPPRPRKYSSSVYESDESSDFTDNSFRSMRSEKKVFHYSTGNLNKEIENDVSSIQNMHRYYTNARDSYTGLVYPRRPSLPKDLCEQQMEYIRQKEKEVEEEIRRIEKERTIHLERKGPRAPLILDEPRMEEKKFDLNESKFLNTDFLFHDSKTRKIEKGKISSAFSKSQEELLREKMYSEYVNQMAEREHRKQQKFIKITHLPVSITGNSISKSMPMLDTLESKVNNRIEKEFINRARERWQKLGIQDPETEDEKELSKDVYREPKVIEHKIKVIQAGEEKDVNKLPNHLQEFVNFTAKTKEQENARTGESEPEQESSHVVVFCAVIILVLAVGKFVLRLLRNK